MRTVPDAKGLMWICLELPDSPVVGTTGTDMVSVECNSGAERAVIVVPQNWDEQSNAQLLSVIHKTLGRPG
jgi:hypothetical protein